MLKFCGVENESTKDHADYMNFFFLPCIVQICYIFSCYFILHSFCSWCTLWYFNFHISLILIPTWLWCRNFFVAEKLFSPSFVFFNLHCTSCPFLYKEQKKIDNEPLKLHYLWSWAWQFKCRVSFQVAGHMQQFTLSWVLFKKGNLICFSITTFLPVLHCSKLNMPSP